MKNKHPLSPVVPLICLLLLAVTGCGHSAPQKTPEPVVVEKHYRDTIYLTNNDFAIGDDCSQAITALHKTNSLLEKCEKDVNGLLDDNAELKDKLEQSGKKVKIRNSYNTKDSYNDTEINNLKKSNQQLAKDNATLQAENAKLVADKNKEKPKEVTKKVGNTKQTEKGSKFWLGVLVATAVFQGVKHGKKFLPPPFNIILGFIA